MPAVNTEPSVVRGFRLPAQVLAKLDTLARQTGRSRAAVLIHLITIAEPTHVPDIRLRTETPSARGTE